VIVQFFTKISNQRERNDNENIMSHSSFDERRKALENAYFHKQDSALLDQLRDRIARLEGKKKLAEATGLQDESLLDRLVALQVVPESLSALLLVPLVEIAWADGIVHQRQREAVFAAAQQAGILRGSVAYATLERWLSSRPSPELLKVWKDYVHAKAQLMDRSALEAMRNDIMDRALFVAEAAGGIFGFHKVAREERAKLDELGVLLKELMAAFD
jgi:DNA-binding phage protein